MENYGNMNLQPFDKNQMEKKEHYAHASNVMLPS